MKARGLITLLVSLGVAGLAALMANKWIAQRLGAAETPSDLVNVVATAADVPVGVTIEPAHVKVLALPPEVVTEGTVTDMNAVLGKVAIQPLYVGEILVQKRLSEKAGGTALSVIIEHGKRALTVRVNDIIGVAGFLLPGSRVDLIWIRGKGSSTETLLQNLKVLAVDQRASSDKNEPVVVRAVTLEVTPKQAEIIARATAEGQVRFTLRNPLDVKEIAKPVAPQPAPVVAEAPAPAPPKPQRRASGYRVDVIRGTAVSRTPVAN